MVEETDSTNRHTVKFSELDKDIQDLVRLTQMKYQISENYHQRYFGNTPSVNGVHAYGRMLVSVGGNIYQSNEPSFDWETPSDFFVSYLKSTLGESWLLQELLKDEYTMHEVAKWYKSAIPNLDQHDPNRWGRPNGKALSLLHLAYDLFVLENEGQLPNFILERLRNKENFNGSRYELFVFATLIRAGFKLEHFDERSGIQGRVPECAAVHTKTGQRVFVEAKTRNVKNVLGSRQGRSKKINLYDKIKDAMEKKINGPYIIFVDINQPKLIAKLGNREFEKVRAEYRKLEQNYSDSMPNLVCFTNIPFHYGRDNESPVHNTIGLMIPRTPKFMMPNRLLNDIDLSLKKYDYLPKEFQESSAHADRVLNEL